MKKIKRKICRNLQCENPVNEPNAAVCKGCKCSLARVNLSILDEDKIEEEVERIRHPEPKGGDDGPGDTGGTVDTGETGNDIVEPEPEYVICPSCNARILYRPGLMELCDCGEYIGDLYPPDPKGGTEPDPPTGQPVTALRSLDGRFHLPLYGDWIKIGRQAAGREYFISAGKEKVSREHAILRYIDGAWHISYCKREDRNYSGGVENPIFINKRRLEREENYRLQPGDEIGLAEFDIAYTQAAFFRAE